MLVETQLGLQGARIMVALDNSGDELPMVKSSREAQELGALGV